MVRHIAQDPIISQMEEADLSADTALVPMVASVWCPGRVQKGMRKVAFIFLFMPNHIILVLIVVVFYY